MQGEGAYVGSGCPLAVSVETGLWNMVLIFCRSVFMKGYQLAWGLSLALKCTGNVDVKEYDWKESLVAWKSLNLSISAK